MFTGCLWLALLFQEGTGKLAGYSSDTTIAPRLYNVTSPLRVINSPKQIVLDPKFLYIGVENVLVLMIPNRECEKILPAISNGWITTIGQHKYVVRINTVSDNIFLRFYSSKDTNLVVAEFSFLGRTVPNPGD